MRCPLAALLSKTRGKRDWVVRNLWKRRDRSVICLGVIPQGRALDPLRFSLGFRAASPPPVPTEPRRPTTPPPPAYGNAITRGAELPLRLGRRERVLRHQPDRDGLPETDINRGACSIVKMC